MLDFDYRSFIDKSGCIKIPRDFSPYMTGNLITVNNRMKEIVKFSGRVALTDAPVLISGPSGVGKEVLAELVHKNSRRSPKPFVKMNCAAVPENLIESEFFGYEAGAFTGALRNGKKGVIELAENGTLFLDEIGEMSLPLQAKLLRVLQDGRYRKVGGEKQLQADIRIIAATNKSLERMIEKGSFREDLYFRLNVILIHIPALKDRKEDIPILSLYYIGYFNSQYNMSKKISREVMEELMDYSWPGNVRELKNTIERLMLVSLEDKIVKKDLDYSTFAVKKYEGMNHVQGFNAGPEGSLKKLVSDYEMSIIQKAIKRYGSIRKAAEALDVNPSTISRKISEYNKENK